MPDRGPAPYAHASTARGLCRFELDKAIGTPTPSSRVFLCGRAVEAKPSLAPQANLWASRNRLIVQVMLEGANFEAQATTNTCTFVDMRVGKSVTIRLHGNSIFGTYRYTRTAAATLRVSRVQSRYTFQVNAHRRSTPFKSFLTALLASQVLLSRAVPRR